MLPWYMTSTKNPVASRAAVLEAEIQRVSRYDSLGSPSYQHPDPVWLHGYPGVVMSSTVPGMIDVRTARGVATVDPSDTNSVQPRSIPMIVSLGGKTYEIFRGRERVVELRGPRGGDYILTQNVHDKSLWGLIPGGQMKPRTTWYRRDDSGAFVPATR